VTRTAVINLWFATEAAGADGAPGCRDVELDVEGERIVAARLVAPGSHYRVHEVPVPLLVAMVGPRDWAAFELDAVAQAERQAERATA